MNGLPLTQKGRRRGARKEGCAIRSLRRAAPAARMHRGGLSAHAPPSPSSECPRSLQIVAPRVGQRTYLSVILALGLSLERNTIETFRKKFCVCVCFFFRIISPNFVLFSLVYFPRCALSVSKPIVLAFSVVCVGFCCGFVVFCVFLWFLEKSLTLWILCGFEQWVCPQLCGLLSPESVSG